MRTPPLLPAQVDRFLELVGSGLSRQEAAAAVQAEWGSGEHGEERCHATASRFRGLYFRDEVFRQRYELALEEAGGRDGTGELRQRLDSMERLRLVERAFDEYWLRAMDPERGRSGSSNRALLNLLTLMSRTFKPFLEARVRHVHSGNVGMLAQPVIDTSKLSLEEQRELIEIERRRRVLIEKATPDEGPEPTALEADDAEFEVLPTRELPGLPPAA